MEVFCYPLGDLSLSMRLLYTHTHTHKRESVKIPIIRLAFGSSTSGAVIKSGAKFERVSQSDGLKPTNKHPSLLRVRPTTVSWSEWKKRQIARCFSAECGLGSNPETATLSSQTATGLRDIKKARLFCGNRDRSREGRKSTWVGDFSCRDMSSWLVAR